ncbi:multiple monosaccharide ABC transporter permease [Sinanaerobacter chloroacetimidivorans]|uniref:Xylose transport system permease protein XylH n=1 Tax=Sinanaerobacter chloroacetimidivorans TaxID=2818044 RepID=A0A8J8B2Z8_9FIRM|nr:multiple monosaccharide ABC transporter permease [Sinanaerobacter chloroacetimidivorans]MBR0597790.1 sugar ABC transporter permease [Sinanaerobacter chloroacetimidivorans]
MQRIKSFLKKNTMLIALIVVIILFQVLIIAAGKGSLLKPQNVSNIIAQNSYVVILATGMLLCILTGGNIDLSVGSIVALVGAVAGTLIIEMHMNVYAAIVVCLLVGTFIGALQAYCIAYVEIPPFIATLGGMLLWRGIAQVILNGMTLAPYPGTYLKYFTSFLPATDDSGFLLTSTLIIAVVVCAVFAASELTGRAKKIKKEYTVESMPVLLTKLAAICAVILTFAYLLGNYKGYPVVLILVAAVVLVYAYFTNNTVPGRYLYALGGNAKATRLSGVNTKKMMFFAYTNMGFLAAVAALICVARFNSSAPSLGDGYELDAIGACFIGGASAYGGTGTVGGTVIGAIFMGVLNNGMSILGIDANWQKAVKGFVLVAAVAFDVISKKKAKA